MARWSRNQLLTFAGMAGVAIIFGVLAYERRWMADDGLIYVRIIKQILAGNGPVFNTLERVEGNTSVLWVWLVAFCSLVTRGEVAYVSVAFGWLCAVGSLILVMDASRRWHRERGSTAILVPFGVLVPLGTFGFWDYATSGLKSSLSLAWIALAWWMLVGLRAQPATSRRELISAIVLGLGPLVRPDLTVASGVFLVAGWLLVRPSRRRTLGLAAAALALPIAYELFRAGYYGLLVPNPALTKSATQSAWGRGAWYLLDFIRPHRMWRIIPVFLAFTVIYRRHLVGRDRILVAAPLVSGALLAVYVTRVGGDFMHARLLLPACFLALAPISLVPLRRWSAIAAALVAVWAVWAGHRALIGECHTRIGDERAGYADFTQDPNPIEPELFVRAAYDPEKLARAIGDKQLVTEGGILMPKSSIVDSGVVVAGRLGASGAAAPLDAHVVDTLGLVHPLGSHITITEPDARPGHQKHLPWAWIFAEYADPIVDGRGYHETPAEQVHAARHALQCGELAELNAAVREPLTVGRFFANLVGSVRRTRLVIPADPIEAERELCR